MRGCNCNDEGRFGANEMTSRAYAKKGGTAVLTVPLWIGLFLCLKLKTEDDKYGKNYG